MSEMRDDDKVEVVIVREYSVNGTTSRSETRKIVRRAEAEKMLDAAATDHILQLIGLRRRVTTTFRNIWEYPKV